VNRSKTLAFVSLPSVLSLVALSFAAPSAYAGGYAAIAYSRSTQAWGEFHGADDEATAESQAATYCGQSDCSWVVEVHGEYGALAVGDKGAGWAWGSDSDSVIANALTKCEQTTQNCSWKILTYADDSGTAKALKNSGTFTHPLNLDHLGGAFSHVIPDFKGFKQEQSEWCWDATTASIIYSMTKATASQNAIARINFPQISGNSSSGNPNALAVLDTLDCLGENAKSARCNHTGQTSYALLYLGKGLPLDQYPDVGDYTGILKDLKASLSKNISAGISISWDEGGGSGGHEISVYGATFSADPSGQSDQVVVDLNVFDPWDGDVRVLNTNVYAPPYQNLAGVWDGYLTLGNYDDANASSLPASICSFLTADDQKNLCK
jgi:hypothetical protein